MGAHNTFKRTSMNQMIFFFDDIQIHGVIHTTADFFSTKKFNHKTGTQKN